MKPTDHRQDIVKTAVITLSSEESLLARKAFISKMTPLGFNLTVQHKDLIPLTLRRGLTLNRLLNKNLSLYIPLMDIDLEVKVITTRHLGKGEFEIKTKFLTGLPAYWRECLSELWPKPQAKQLRDDEIFAFNFPAARKAQSPLLFLRSDKD